jgi:hypothetical protein
MKNTSHRLSVVTSSVFLGMTALLISFVVASAFETPGTTSVREITAMCVAAGLYLAFCQFWVSPRGVSRFRTKLPTLAASVAPLTVATAFAPRTQGILWLASGCLGSVIGALIAQKVTTPPPEGPSVAISVNRGRSCRRNLVAGFYLLAAVALLIPIGVIPPVLADGAPDFNAGPVGKFLGITVIFDLWAVAILASAIWRPRQRDPSSKGTLGTTAFLGLLLGLSYCGMGVLVSGHGRAMRLATVLLILCAAFGLIITALMTVTSAMVDRERLRVERKLPADTRAGQNL